MKNNILNTEPHVQNVKASASIAMMLKNNCGVRLHKSGRVGEGLVRYQEAAQVRIDQVRGDGTFQHPLEALFSRLHHEDLKELLSMPPRSITRSLDVFHHDIEDLSAPSCSLSDPIETDGTGSDFEESATLLYNMGIAHCEIGNTDKADKLLEMAKSISVDPHIVSKSLTAQAEIKILSEPASSKNLLLQALQIQQQQLLMRADNPCGQRAINACIATTFSLMGRAQFFLGSYEQALWLCKQALRLRWMLYGQDSIHVASTLFNMGIIHKAQGHLDEAYHLVQHFIWRSSLQDEESHWLCQVAAAWQIGGSIKLELEDHEVALDHLTKALQIRHHIYHPKHIRIAETLTSLGRACFGCGNLHMSLCYYTAALKGQITAENCAAIKCYMGHIYHSMNASQDALEAYRSALEHALAVPDLAPDTIAALATIIGNLLRQQGHSQEAYTYLATASAIRSLYTVTHHHDLSTTDILTELAQKFPPASPAA